MGIIYASDEQQFGGKWMRKRVKKVSETERRQRIYINWLARSEIKERHKKGGLQKS